MRKVDKLRGWKIKIPLHEIHVGGLYWHGNYIITGAEGQNRTADTVIFSHLLYRLSYLGAN